MIADTLARLVVFIPLSNGAEGVVSTAQGLLLAGGIFLAAGSIVAYSCGHRLVATARRYLGAEPFNDASSMDEGLVSITGAIVPPGESVRGPMTGEECVIYEDETQELRRDWKYDRDERIEMRQRGTFDEEERERKVTGWQTTSFDREHVPFLVETDHGPVAVDPADATLDLPVRATEGSSLLARTLHRSRFVGSLARNVGFIRNPSRRVERHLKAGDAVVVLGDVDRLETDGDSTGPRTERDAVAEVNGGDELFLITRRSRWILAIRATMRAIASSLPGLALVLVGLLLVAIAIVMGLT